MLERNDSVTSASDCEGKLRGPNSVSFIKTNHLMLYGEIMAVCSEIHTKHINTLCGQNVELLNVKLAVHIVTHWALKG